MMSLPFTTRLVVVLLLTTVASQPAQSQRARPNPEEQPRKVKAEPRKAYVNWISDVAPILTDEERAA
jgi:hypothetical protein